MGFETTVALSAHLNRAIAFQALGLNVQQLIRMKPDQQFETIAAAIARIPNPTAKAGAAMQLFGRSGTVLLPVFNNLRSLTNQAREFGLVTSTEAAEAGHKLEQSMGLLSAVLKKIVTTIGGALAPSSRNGMFRWRGSLSE